ncbi:unnamed protein product, partial [Amoebophrya sp. A120]
QPQSTRGRAGLAVFSSRVGAGPTANTGILKHDEDTTTTNSEKKFRFPPSSSAARSTSRARDRLAHPESTMKMKQTPSFCASPFSLLFSSQQAATTQAEVREDDDDLTSEVQALDHNSSDDEGTSGREGVVDLSPGDSLVYGLEDDVEAGDHDDSNGFHPKYAERVGAGSYNSSPYRLLSSSTGALHSTSSLRPNFLFYNDSNTSTTAQKIF